MAAATRVSAIDTAIHGRPADRSAHPVEELDTDEEHQDVGEQQLRADQLDRPIRPQGVRQAVHRREDRAGVGQAHTAADGGDVAGQATDGDADDRRRAQVVGRHDVGDVVAEQASVARSTG